MRKAQYPTNEGGRRGQTTTNSGRYALKMPRFLRCMRGYARICADMRRESWGQRFSLDYATEFHNDTP